jgi:hypothetical protein
MKRRLLLFFVPAFRVPGRAAGVMGVIGVIFPQVPQFLFFSLNFFFSRVREGK